MTANAAWATFGCIVVRYLCFVFGKKLLSFRREVNSAPSQEHFYVHSVYTILCSINGRAVQLRCPAKIGLNMNVIAINGPGDVIAKPNFASRVIAKNIQPPT